MDSISWRSQAFSLRQNNEWTKTKRNQSWHLLKKSLDKMKGYGQSNLLRLYTQRKVRVGLLMTHQFL